MSLPRGTTARQLIQALHQDGFQLRRTTGSHRMYRHPDGRRLVVAYHKLSDTFPIGTLRAMMTDAGWDDPKLRQLGLL